jgi:DNA-binding transcriptional MerR regulator
LAVYSINDLEKISGIKAHTLRIWEQRYGIIKPHRTDTNIRFYHDEDLRQVLNIALLNKNGYKISRIASMSGQEMQHLVAGLADINQEHATQLDALTLSAIELDEYKFDRIIRAHIEQSNFEEVMLHVIYPFLEKLSILWLTGSISPVQESFFSNLVRQKLITAIEQEHGDPRPGSPKFVLYLPEGEKQELSLLFMHYLLRKRHLLSVYLGPDISLSDLVDACHITKPDYIFTMITETFTNIPLEPYITTLGQNLPDQHLLLSGFQALAQNIESTSRRTILRSLDAAMQFISAIDQPAGQAYLTLEVA